jgi:hypothetical protein
MMDDLEASPAGGGARRMARIEARWRTVARLPQRTKLDGVSSYGDGAEQ